MPFIGHAINMLLQGANYFYALHNEYNHGIYTLPIFNTRMYIVSSPDWLGPIHKHSKTISFNALVVGAMKKFLCQDEETMEIYRQNANNENGDRSGIIHEQHDLMAHVLAHGPDLEAMTTTVLNEEAARVNRLAPGNATQEIDLWYWIRHNFSLASLTALYGPESPYDLDTSLEEAYWQVDSSALALGSLPWPYLLAPKAYKAREKIFTGYMEYFEKEAWKSASAFIKRQIELKLEKYNIFRKMCAFSEITMNVAALSNTIPTAWWLLCFIFADNKLLQDIRNEVDSCVTIKESRHLLNIEKLKSQCPLLNSTFRETQRYTGYLNSARQVLSDTEITNTHTGQTYTLKKGSFLQIATNVIHSNSSIYGSDSHHFRANRFIHQFQSDKPIDPAAAFRDKGGKVHSRAFRSFGSGNAICLGRHFAQSEILGLIALFVAGFEIVDRGEVEGFTMPEVPSYRFPMDGVPHAKGEVLVDVRRRRGFEDVEWGFEI